MGFLRALRLHPKGFWFIFFGELAERSSFYGMKALLAMYLINVMHMSEAGAGPVIHVFTAFCYLLPLLGGFVADRWLGKFRTIIYFAVPYICGHLILGSSTTRTALFIALALLAGGSGAIKPNISPLMGQMYDESGGGDTRLRSQAFAWFYAAINIGAAISMFILPVVRNKWGFQVAFLCPTVLMAVSLFIFYLGKKHYPQEKTGIRVERTPSERSEDRRSLTGLIGVFILLVPFWAIFDQASSTWVFFAHDHTRLYGLAPDMLQGFNPLLVILLTPVFNWFWSWLGKKRGRIITFTEKMNWGFGIVVLCMSTMGLAGYLSTTYGKVSVVWEMAAFVLITIAELCISIVGLEMAYAESPAHMKSTTTALFLLTIFFGNLLAGVLSSIYPHVAPGSYFFGLAGLMVFITIAFRFVSRELAAKHRAAAV